MPGSLRLLLAAAAAAAAGGRAHAQANTLYPVTDAMRAAAAAIAAHATAGPNATLIWDRLATMTDTFGGRLGGSSALERALDWVRDQAATVDGLRVTEHHVSVPHWRRCADNSTDCEWARMLSPRNKSLHFVGLGGSNSTFGVVQAAVMVVASFDELDARGAEAAGKIVLFNAPWVSYGVTVAYRSACAVRAARYGAVGALVRAVGPFGIQTPHTGSSQTAAIAAGSLSAEDAALVARIVARGQPVVLAMYMEAATLAPAPSRNLLIDLPGSAKPDEYVIISGHMDSWDVAEGAMDDGGGAFGAWHAVRLLATLGIAPQRTIRAVLWTNEENGAAGGRSYAVDYAATLNATSLAIESDEGSFTPYQLGFSGHPAALLQLQVLAELLGPLGAGNVSSPGGGTDIGPMCDLGVPCAGLEVLDPRLSDLPNNPCRGYSAYRGGGTTNQIADGYFWYHHTAGDTVDKLDPQQLNLVAAALATWALGVSELPALLPRSGDVPALPSSGGGGPAGGGAGAIAGGVAGACAVVVAAALWAFRGRLSRRPWGGRGVVAATSSSGATTLDGAAYHVPLAATE